jgi:hypothetical protein
MTPKKNKPEDDKSIKKVIKTSPLSNIEEIGCIKNQCWNNDFEFGDTWPEDMNERLWEWYNTPTHMLVKKGKKYTSDGK